MQHILKTYKSFFSLLLIIFSGCSLTQQAPIAPDYYLSSDEPARIIQEANDVCVRVANEMSTMKDQGITIPQWFIDDYKKATDDLEAAQNSTDRLDAYLAAERSIVTAQRILRNLNLEIVIPVTEQATAELEGILQKDQDSPLDNFRDEFAYILRSARNIESELRLQDLYRRSSYERIDHEHILQELEEVYTLFSRFRRTIAAYNNSPPDPNILNTDVFFHKGEYQLTKDAQILLQGIVASIFSGNLNAAKKKSEGEFIINIKVIGYADPLGFREGSSLVKSLLKGVEASAPTSQPARKEFLNKRLSLFRADAIQKYINLIIGHYQYNNPHLQMSYDITVEGKGEELPPGLVPLNSQSADSRRRICKIYSSVYPHFSSGIFNQEN